MSKKRLIATTACVAIAATTVIGGTLAYLRDTKTADIELRGDDHVLVQEVNASVNENKIFPGKTVVFDPTITVDTTARAYVFAELTGDGVEYIDMNDVSSDWTEIPGASNTSKVYYRIIDGAENPQQLHIFTDGLLSFSTDITNDTMPQRATISVKGSAIQADYLPDNTDLMGIWGLASAN